MQAVGLQIGTPTASQPDVNETLLAKHIVSLLPSSYDHTKEIIFTKQPLSLKTICNHLEAKYLDSKEITVKIESAHKARGQTGNSSNKCSGGKHNPKARHKNNCCYKLYPHIKEEDKAKKAGKSQIHC
jgi:hypothetical protein